MRNHFSSRIVPVLLAAGASSRMGRTKALLDFDGQTALELALDAMVGLAAPIVVLGPNRREIEAQVDLSGSRIAVNPDLASGQTASLCAGLALLPPDAEAFIFMPVDHPLVRRADVARLVEVARAVRSKDVFIPFHATRRGHPVLCRRSIAAEVLDLPAGTAARVALNASPIRVAEVPFEDASILLDMDTPDDYARCLAVFRERGGVGKGG